MMRYTSIFCSFIIFLCMSCENTPKEVSFEQASEMDSKQLFGIENRLADKQCTLEEVAVIDIPIDSVSLNHSIYPLYYDADTTQYYITGNENQHSVDFYDLEKKKMVKRVHFAREGAEGIPNIGQFIVKNLDTLIFLPKSQKQIIITNLEGEILKRTNTYINDEDEMSHGLGAPFAIMDSLLILPKMKTKPPMEMVGINTMAGLNMYTGKVIEYGLKLPAAFKEKQAPIGQESPRFVLVGDKISVRFGLLSVIYQYDIKSKQTTIFPLKSKHQKQAITLSDYVDYRKMVAEVSEKENYEKSSYQKLLYDQYRGVYYSIFVEGIPLIDEKTGLKNDYEDRPISIIIADKDFNYMGEKRLEKHYFRNFLVTKDGLLVSNAHLKNPHNKEDMLSFTLFKLKYQ